MDGDIRQKILTLLDQHRIMTIATLRPDGWPQATTVGYANDGLTLYFLCGPDSQKAGNLARDDRVSLTIDHDTPQVMEITGLSMAARASSGGSDRSREGLAPAHAEVSAAGPHTTTNADPGGCPHISRDPDGDLRARLLQGLRTRRSRHLLRAFPARISGAPQALQWSPLFVEWIGSKIVNIVPCPGDEFTATVPPCARMILWLTDRPRPVPDCFVV